MGEGAGGDFMKAYFLNPQIGGCIKLIKAQSESLPPLWTWQKVISSHWEPDCAIRAKALC